MTIVITQLGLFLSACISFPTPISLPRLKSHITVNAAYHLFTVFSQRFLSQFFVYINNKGKNNFEDIGLLSSSSRFQPVIVICLLKTTFFLKRSYLLSQICWTVRKWLWYPTPVLSGSSFVSHPYLNYTYHSGSTTWRQPASCTQRFLRQWYRAYAKLASYGTQSYA